MLDRHAIVRRYGATKAQFKKAAIATFGEDVETAPDNYLDRFLESLLCERRKLTSACVNSKH